MGRKSRELSPLGREAFGPGHSCFTADMPEMGHTWSHLPPKPTITCPQVPEGPSHLFPLWVYQQCRTMSEHIVPSGEALLNVPRFLPL